MGIPMMCVGHRVRAVEIGEEKEDTGWLPAKATTRCGVEDGGAHLYFIHSYFLQL